MTTPLVWMPTLDVRHLTGDFAAWSAGRFLKTYGGRGHIIAAAPGPWPSVETLEPRPGAHWYCTKTQRVAKRSRPLDITVEMPVPLGAGSDALSIIDAAQAVGPLKRLVMLRPPDAEIERLAISLKTLKDSVHAPLWLDCTTFGWTALSYFLVSDPTFQASGVDESELWQLMRLAELTGRPLVLDDLSEAEPLAIPDLPRFDQGKMPGHVFKTLPSWGRSR